MRRVYLDHAATTPPAPEVVAAMSEAMTVAWGNPSSVHGSGRTARRLVNEARAEVARLIGAEPSEITFTSGGTEADNLAIRGAALARRDRGRHLITSNVEHSAVLQTCRALEAEGWDVTYVPVGPDGLINPAAIAKAMRPDTVLVSVMLANNEIGTIQPVAELSPLCQERGIALHTDAVQAVGQIPVDVNELGVDLLTLSAHKIYGPKGIGALYVRHGTKLTATSYGGSHERQRRAGTENVPGIAGFGVAARLARERLPQRQQHLANLRDRFIDGVLQTVPGTKLNGAREPRLPGNANITFSGVSGEPLLINLDMKGIAVSAGSACASGSLEPSPVIIALGQDKEEAMGAIRFTFGQDNTEDDVDYVLAELPPLIERLRKLSPVGR